MGRQWSGVAFFVALFVMDCGEAAATCAIPKHFQSYGPDPQSGNYLYIHFSPTADNEIQTIVGRFWQTGSRAAANEGWYDDSAWLHSYSQPPMWYLAGELSDGGVTGCPSNDMTVLLQTTRDNNQDAEFIIGRVTETPEGQEPFGFWRTGSDWNAAPLPGFCRSKADNPGGTQRQVEIRIDPLSGGFHGLPGMTLEQSVTGLAAYTSTAWSVWGDPGRGRGQWMLRSVAPYNPTGQSVTSFSVDCPAGAFVRIAVGLVLENGALYGDFVGRSQVIACTPGMYYDPWDGDEDGADDRCDNCGGLPNPSQSDVDGDGLGDACDACPGSAGGDPDGDNLCPDVDNCPWHWNPDQADSDADGAGNVCDNCQGLSNSGQANADGDAAGDACDPCPFDSLNDADADGHCANVDNCPTLSNPSQADNDGDGEETPATTASP